MPESEDATDSGRRPRRSASRGVRLDAESRHVRARVAEILGRPGRDRSLELRGADWGSTLDGVLEALTHAEGLALHAVPLDDPEALPVSARTALERARTPWLPGLLDDGGLVPHFEPIVDLASGAVHGREALLHAEHAGTALSSGQIVQAASDHDALSLLDAQARTSALEVGLPLLPPGETLHVNVMPTAISDPTVSLRTTIAVARRLGMASTASASRWEAGAFPDPGFLAEVVDGYRAAGAPVALDDLGSGSSSLRCLRDLRPDVVKLEEALVAGLDGDRARRRMLAALVDDAHERGVRVVATGIGTAADLRACQAAGVDLGQGPHLGRPSARLDPVDATLVTGLALAA